MVIIDELKKVVRDAKNNPNSEYRRNLLREKLQIYVLNFVYTSKYKSLIFTGGTCLRKFYGLPRISEDLDFNIESNEFDFDKFQKDLANYFTKKIGFKNFSFKFNGRTVLIKFPILREIGFAGPNDSEILFLRLDFAFNKEGKTNNISFTQEGFSFIARCYDVNTLFINKIDAFLNRTYKKGSDQQESFKGRDAFDLVWMLGESRKKTFKLSPITKSIKEKILKKAKKIKSEELYVDLGNFFADQVFARQFCDNFYQLLETDIEYV